MRPPRCNKCMGLGRTPVGDQHDGPRHCMQCSGSGIILEGPNPEWEWSVRPKPEAVEATQPNQDVDPKGLDQHIPGAKLDANKIQASLILNFSRALAAVAMVSDYGARKYTRDGWEQVPDGIRRYRDAEWRHMLRGQVEEMDAESGIPHSFHKLWNALAVLELELREGEEKSS